MIEKCDEHPTKGVLFCGGPPKKELKQEEPKAKECDDEHEHEHEHEHSDDDKVGNPLLKAIDVALKFVNTYQLTETAE